jgi:hypothetical protein
MTATLSLSLLEGKSYWNYGDLKFYYWSGNGGWVLKNTSTSGASWSTYNFYWCNYTMYDTLGSIFYGPVNRP